jgi:methylenetetrahydrofolate--tRNA-(uracil-5-)-methyltransferase
MPDEFLWSKIQFMNDNFSERVTIIGAGLAGSEAAWQLGQRGINVDLFEMRPEKETGAHLTGNFAELVCSNSLGSNLTDRASGLLKNELRSMNSLIMKIADECSTPAGGALAVDRDLFASRITEILSNHPHIHVMRKELTTIPETPTIISSGPLTSPALSSQIINLTKENNLFFYDAIAPIINFESIDLSIAFRASRYNRGEDEAGDYINCPFNEEQYYQFINALKNAERIKLRTFEEAIDTGVKAGAHKFFEGCLPVEIIAGRGDLSLAFGPLRPVGIIDPHTQKRPFAVLQLRQDNIAGDLYNLVGFQTNLTFSEQKRVFKLIPGLQNATFARFGQMHRNTFIASPLLLKPTLQFITNDSLFFAGQITGVEGYVGNIATGLIAGLNMSRFLNENPPLEFPKTTMIGALIHYVTHADMKDFQPMKANYGIIPPLEEKIKDKRDRNKAYSERALNDLQSYIKNNSQDNT